MQADRDGQEKSIRDHALQEEGQGLGCLLRGCCASWGRWGERRLEPRHYIGDPLDEVLIRVVPAVRVI